MSNETQSTPADKIIGNVLSLEDEKTMDEPGRELESSAGGPVEEILKERIIEAIRTVYDPEIPINIYELGLIYRLDVNANGEVEVDMTLTSPACPVAGTLPPEVEQKIRSVPGVEDVELELVWEPPFSIDMMSEAARLQLGLF